MHETLLISTLLSIVDEDDFYSLSEIKSEFGIYFESAHWIHERYVGRLLRRLGFRTRRRVGTGYQYFFRVKEVEELAHRLAINTDNVGSELGVDAGEGGVE